MKITFSPGRLKTALTIGWRQRGPLLKSLFLQFLWRSLSEQWPPMGLSIAAPEIAKNGAYTSVFADWWAYKFEVYYSTAYNATILNENGVTNSINSDSNELIRHLNHEAAKTVRYGETSEADALKMITINPAKQLGIDDMVGSLEIGKQGDVAIWSGHPLSIYSKVEHTYVDGKKYFDLYMDPVDMRIAVDSEDSYTEAGFNTFIQGREEDSCMSDVFELIQQ